jgi:hypothetical protein
MIRIVNIELNLIIRRILLYLIVIQECMQMSGWQTLMRTAVLCSRAEYFTDQHHTSRQTPLGEWFVDERFCLI